PLADRSNGPVFELDGYGKAAQGRSDTAISRFTARRGASSVMGSTSGESQCCPNGNGRYRSSCWQFQRPLARPTLSIKRNTPTGRGSGLRSARKECHAALLGHNGTRASRREEDNKPR